MKLTFTSLLLLFIIQISVGQTVRRLVSAPYIGMGAYTTGQVDVFSTRANQAALAQIKGVSAGVYGEQRFMLQHANMFSAAVAVPSQHGNFALQADYFGYANFNESQLGLAYARSLGEALDVGIQFDYYSFRIPAYQSSSAITFEIGVIAHLTDKLNAGVHIYNPVGGQLSKTHDEKLNSIYQFGLGFEPTESFLISAEIIKEEGLPANVNAGMQYNFDKRFFARAGVMTDTGSPYAGAGVAWQQFRLDVAASYHPQLGFSPGIMIIFNPKPSGFEGK